MENYKNSKIGQETAQKYGDIIEMERPQTEESLRKHPRMTLQNRAKIFSPFAALRGYDEQLAAEKQRTERVPKRILTEEEMSALSDRLMQVTKGMTITVRYFKEDTLLCDFFVDHAPIQHDPFHRTEHLVADQLAVLTGERIAVHKQLRVKPNQNVSHIKNNIFYHEYTLPVLPVGL